MTYGYAGFGSPRVPYRTRGALNYRDTTPVASLEEYEAYRRSLNHPVARNTFDSRKWRRVAIIRRGGECFKTACKLAGVAPNKALYDKMPDHLK